MSFAEICSVCPAACVAPPVAPAVGLLAAALPVGCAATVVAGAPWSARERLTAVLSLLSLLPPHAPASSSEAPNRAPRRAIDELRMVLPPGSVRRDQPDGRNACAPSSNEGELGFVQPA